VKGILRLRAKLLNVPTGMMSKGNVVPTKLEVPQSQACISSGDSDPIAVIGFDVL
jgi:hypothetical protein